MAIQNITHLFIAFNTYLDIIELLIELIELGDETPADTASPIINRSASMPARTLVMTHLIYDTSTCDLRIG